MKKFTVIILLLVAGISFAQNEVIPSPDAGDFNLKTAGNYVPVSFSENLNAILGFWYPANTYPSMPEASYFQASAWLGDTLYVQIPTSAGVGDVKIYKYTLGGSWSAGVPMPVGKVGGSLTKVGNKLYYVGGGTTTITTGTTDVYEYTPSTGAWFTKAPVPIAISGHGAVNWGDSVLFVVGGPYAGSGTNLNIYYYRPATDTWGTISNSLPTGQGRRTFGCAISGNKIVIAGGFNTAFLKTAYVGTIGANAASITWTALPDVPTVWSGLSRPGGTAYLNFFYLVNGERGGAGGYYDTTHVLNLNTNTWIGVLDNIPFKRSNIFNAVTSKPINDTIKIFVPGGYGNVISSGTGAVSALFDVAAYTATIIPVELSSFGYSLNNGEVVLNWSTATETNNSGFEVQRSNDGKQFMAIGFVSGNGTSTNINNYSFTDKGINGKYYYRLKQIDVDGTYKISNMIEVNTSMVVTYFLKQNYPNPFNPITNITYSIPQKTTVTLKVYDITGREVAVLVSGDQDAGMHNVAFDSRGLGSGIYFYTLTAGNFIETKKMTLLK